jgi:hypothetical protein
LRKIAIFVSTVDDRIGAVALTMLLSYAVAICFGSIPSIIILRRIAAWQIANGAADGSVPPSAPIELPPVNSSLPLTRVDVLGGTISAPNSNGPAMSSYDPETKTSDVAFSFDIHEFDGVDFCVYAPTVGTMRHGPDDSACTASNAPA